MTPTHAISADEARRLLSEDREQQRLVAKARAFVDAGLMTAEQAARLIENQP